MKTIRRIIKVMCPICLGVGSQYYDGRKRQCHECRGTGLVERVVNEVESVEDKE
jgi:DnaJ-class molecular chaperone